MSTSATGREFDEAFEGCNQPIAGRPGFFTTYRDGVDVLTLGYGHTNLGGVPPAIAEGDVWTKALCDAALGADLASVDAEVDKVAAAHGLTFTQAQHDSCASFQMNTGDFGKSSIPERLAAGDLSGAMAVWLEYDHAGGRVEAGLTRRRHAEVLMFHGDVASALALAGVHKSLGGKMMRASMRPTP